MHIRLRDISAGMSVKIQGDETWLDEMYRDFPVLAADAAKPRLTGALQLFPSDIGDVDVRGTLSYAPFVTCNRCLAALTLPLAIDVDVRFVPAQHDTLPKEKTLSAAEAEAYELTGGGVDVEQLVNDMVQTSVPSKVLCDACQSAADAGDDRVYTTDRGDASPFAALRTLKLPD